MTAFQIVAALFVGADDARLLAAALGHLLFRGSSLLPWRLRSLLRGRQGSAGSGA